MKVWQYLEKNVINKTEAELKQDLYKKDIALYGVHFNNDAFRPVTWYNVCELIRDLSSKPEDEGWEHNNYFTPGIREDDS